MFYFINFVELNINVTGGNATPHFTGFISEICRKVKETFG
jgi:hypothetical protein